MVHERVDAHELESVGAKVVPLTPRFSGEIETVFTGVRLVTPR